MKARDYITWTIKDNNEDSTIVGQVTKIKNNRVEFSTNSGVINVPSNDGVFKVITKTEAQKQFGYGKPAKVSKNVTSHQRSTPAPTKRPKGFSKQDQVNDIFMVNKNASRKEVIAMIVERGITTAAGASTMYSNAKKIYGGTVG